jgi:ABC-type multidrug transport system permease subunit
MQVLLLMIRKDLTRRRRQPLGYLVSLSFPLVFALLLALAFGGGEVKPRVHLLVENRDEGALGEFLAGAFQSDQMAEYFEIEPAGEEGRARMEQGDASALLIIPQNFSEDLLAGRPLALALVRNPAQSILPQVAEELGHVLAEVLSAASQVLREPLDSLASILEGDAGPSDAVVAALSIAMNQAITGVVDYVFPPVITLETSTLQAEDAPANSGGGTGSVFLFVLPGISVFGLFIVGDLAMRDLLEETAAGTLRRQLAGPVGTGSVVAAKALYAGVLTSVTLVILSLVGWIVSPAAVSLTGFLVLSASLVVSVTGLASLVYGLSGDPNRGSTLGTILYLAMAMLGGSFVPLNSMPGSLRAYSPLSLFYWANDGYSELLQNGVGVAEILPQAGVLAAAGVGLLSLGAWLLGRRVRQGVTA